MKKVLLVVGGSISLSLGILGMFLPLLPTVPFLLLTAACYMKSSDRLYHWLISHKHFGKIILDYQENRSISVKTKIYSVTLLWISICLSAFLFVSYWWIRVLLFCVAIGVTIHILSHKSKKNSINRCSN